MDIRPGRSLHEKRAAQIEKRREQADREARMGRKIAEEFSSDEGRAHVQQMLNDLTLAVNTLSSRMTPDQAMIAIGRIEYIRERVSAWIGQIDLGKLAAERLSSIIMETNKNS